MARAYPATLLPRDARPWLHQDSPFPDSDLTAFRLVTSSLAIRHAVRHAAKSSAVRTAGEESRSKPGPSRPNVATRRQRPNQFSCCARSATPKSEISGATSQKTTFNLFHKEEQRRAALCEVSDNVFGQVQIEGKVQEAAASPSRARVQVRVSGACSRKLSRNSHRPCPRPSHAMPLRGPKLPEQLLQQINGASGMPSILRTRDGRLTARRRRRRVRCARARQAVPQGRAQAGAAGSQDTQGGTPR
jgi:hypothetical protein